MYIWLVIFCQFILLFNFFFIIIHKFHCTFWYYLYVLLYYFQLTFTFIYSTFNKKIQFQQNKQILNKYYKKLFLTNHQNTLLIAQFIKPSRLIL